MGRPRRDPMEVTLEQLDAMTPKERSDWLLFVTRWVHCLNAREAKPASAPETKEGTDCAKG